ncbi:hypothetical protein DSL92_08390 [Billgrantia gudaonensis]|uniref:Uncharacterized protein n=1 Tax=Billgrantia gudaonensis TaxID=376427 RepID=A0A432JGM9_9GAMM|nr:hypothetical protein DSL92_08390 [Halomonas gudaonensis]
MVRHSYGDWQWYVEGRRHLLSGCGDAGRPPGHWGGVSTRGLELPAQLSHLSPKVAASHPLVVERSRAGALSRRLMRLPLRDLASVFPEFNLVFVRDPRDYWLAHQSNLVASGWLEELRGGGERTWLSCWRMT